MFSGRVQSWSAFSKFIGHTFPLHNGRTTPAVLTQPVFLDLLKNIKPRKRGRRSGVRQRNKARQHKPYLPAIIMGNVQAFENKLHELAACVKFQHEYCMCSIMCYKETWLSDDVRDSHVNMEGFSLFRSNRTKDSGKKNGGGVCLFAKEKWCHRNNMSVKHKVCTPNVQLLTDSVRPYYIPQKFSHVLITTVYARQSANAKNAAKVISSHVIDLVTSAPDAFKMITGDFNHCSLKTAIINYFQHVKCATQKDHILDQCYTNVKDTYRYLCVSPSTQTI